MKIAIINYGLFSLKLIQQTLKSNKYQFLETNNTKTLDTYLSIYNIDLVISDEVNFKSLTFLNNGKQFGLKKVALILITSPLNDSIKNDMKEFEDDVFLYKPFTSEELLKKNQYFEFKNALK